MGRRRRSNRVSATLLVPSSSPNSFLGTGGHQACAAASRHKTAAAGGPPLSRKIDAKTPVGGISVTVSAVRPAAGGDNLVNVGYILSGNNDLGAVTVKGDLGGIDAGDANRAWGR
jgi:hypothetical protein